MPKCNMFVACKYVAFSGVKCIIHATYLDFSDLRTRNWGKFVNCYSMCFKSVSWTSHTHVSLWNTSRTHPFYVWNSHKFTDTLDMVEKTHVPLTKTIQTSRNDAVVQIQNFTYRASCWFEKVKLFLDLAKTTMASCSYWERVANVPQSSYTLSGGSAESMQQLLEAWNGPWGT